MEILISEQNHIGDGIIQKCKQCSGAVCCGIIAEGGTLEPPYISNHDIKEIEYHTGLKRDQFAVQKKNLATNNLIYVMRTRLDKGCIFFDWNDGKCQIHAFRPIDCKLFPLDVRCIQGEHYWALFKYSRCKVNCDDLAPSIGFREEFISLIGDELHDYATQPAPGMAEVGYEILSKISLGPTYE